MKKTYDVVIVGCGVAGCFTALNLPQNKEVLMISKGDLDESDSFLAQGGICVQKSDDDYDDFYEDTMKAGHYENKPESVDKMIKSSREVIAQLLEFGVDFNKENGELLYTKEGAHSTNRILFHDDVTGREITSKLLDRVKERDNITLLSHTMMVDILCKGNRCDGLLIKTQSGNIEAVFAKHVMWACGGIGGIYENSTNFPSLTGDALAIALRHNIKLQDVDYVQIHPTTLYSTKKERRFLISESVRGEGAKLYDKNGKRFVNELLPRDVVSNEIFKQMEKDGTNHVWLSMMDITEVDITKRFPNICKKCLEEGIDVTKEMIPVVPGQHYFMGGVHIDLNGHTSMRHLYAAGETACNGVHGANRLASNSLLESLVFAKSAAVRMTEADAVPHTPKYESYMEMTISELQEVYGINIENYADMVKYQEENKELVRNEIKAKKEQRAEQKRKEIAS